MVIYVDPNAGARESVKQLIQAGIQRKYGENIRAQEYAANPDRIAALAPAYRRAVEAGQGENFLVSLGLPQEFGQAFDSFRPDVAETTERELLRQGTIPKQVTQATREAEVGIEEADTLLGSGLIPQRAKVEGKELGLRERLADASTEFGLPEAQVSDAMAEFAHNAFTRAEEVTQTKYNAQFRDAYSNFYSSLQPGSAVHRIATMALANPRQLSHLEFQQSQGLQERLAMLRLGAESQVDVLRNTMTIQESILKQANFALDVRRMEQDHNLTPDEAESLRAAAAAGLEATNRIARGLAETGQAYPLNPPSASVVDNEFEFAFDEPMTRVERLLQAFGTGDIKLEDLRQVDPETGKSPLQSLSEEERALFFRNLQVTPASSRARAPSPISRDIIQGILEDLRNQAGAGVSGGLETLFQQGQENLEEILQLQDAVTRRISP